MLSRAHVEGSGSTVGVGEGSAAAPQARPPQHFVVEAVSPLEDASSFSRQDGRQGLDSSVALSALSCARKDVRAELLLSFTIAGA